MNIPDTPKVTGALVLLSRQRVASDLELVGSIEYDYVGSRTDAPYGTTITLLDPQPQINLQTAAFTRYTINRPRTAGIDISYHFGR
jgi:hypothetical protein